MLKEMVECSRWSLALLKFPCYVSRNCSLNHGQMFTYEGVVTVGGLAVLSIGLKTLLHPICVDTVLTYFKPWKKNSEPITNR